MPSSLTRRGFLASASALAASALAACGAAGGMGGVPSDAGAGGSDLPLPLETDRDRRLARVERRHFEPLVGDSLRMSESAPDAGQDIYATLTKVIDDSATNPDAAAMGFREPFSLGMRGPDDGIAREGTYVLNHPEIGDIDVFVSSGGLVEETGPSGERVSRQAYRIQFN